MKFMTRKFLYKLLSVVTIYISLMPLVSTLRYKFAGYGIDFFGLVLPFIMLMSGFFYGINLVRDDSNAISRLLSGKYIKFIMFFINKKLSVRGFTLAAAYISVIFPAALSLCINLGRSWWFALADGAVFILFYLIGVRCSLLSFECSFTNYRIYLGSIALAVALSATYFFNNVSLLRAYVLFSSYLFILSGMLIRSELSIETGVMGRRGSDKRVIPGGIRRYNNIAVFTVFGLILVLFNFKNTVAFILRLLGKAVAFIILLFLELVSYLFPKGDGESTGTPPDMLDKLREEKPANPIANFFIFAAVIIILLYCSYKLLPYVFLALKKMLGALTAFFRRLISPSSIDSEGTEREYYDEVETIKKVKAPSAARMRRKMTDRSNFSKTGDPAMKVRLIYKNIISHFIKKGIDIRSTDTTREIQLKTAETEDTDNLMGHITRVYESVRYGDYIPDTSEADSVIKEYVSLIRKKKKKDSNK